MVALILSHIIFQKISGIVSSLRLFFQENGIWVHKIQMGYSFGGARFLVLWVWAGYLNEAVLIDPGSFLQLYIWL